MKTKKVLTEEEIKNVLGGSNDNNKQVICPRCKEPIGTTLEMIIQTKTLVCPNCGLKLHID